MRIALVAGELSGDLLGAGLIRALRARFPAAVFEGIGGPAMLAEGFHSRYPLELLSVMGLVEVLGRYRQLKRCHVELGEYFLAQRPDVFIGIDAPDFNLGLERRLKAAGIPTAHYVSPSVWAWRAYRLKKIARSCDLMLTLFPFEAAYYQKHAIPVCFTGHPLADQIPLEVDQQAARASLGLAQERQWLALLPGSRRQEVQRLLEPFLRTAVWLAARRPDLGFVLPLAGAHLRETVESAWRRCAPDLPLILLDGQARLAMSAADAVLLASGTATLEALLLKRPMVVAYRMAAPTYWLARRLVKVRHFSLPNLLAGESLVPEFLQDRVRPELLGPPLLEWLSHPPGEMRARFQAIHRGLQCQADQRAAAAVAGLIQETANSAG